MGFQVSNDKVIFGGKTMGIACPLCGGSKIAAEAICAKCVSAENLAKAAGDLYRALRLIRNERLVPGSDLYAMATAALRKADTGK